MTEQTTAARIGSAVKAWRSGKGMSQAQVAERLNVDTSVVSLWESGKRTPSVALLVRLHRMTGISLDVMCGLREA